MAAWLQVYSDRPVSPLSLFLSHTYIYHSFTHSHTHTHSLTTHINITLLCSSVLTWSPWGPHAGCKDAQSLGETLVGRRGVSEGAPPLCPSSWSLALRLSAPSLCLLTPPSLPLTLKLLVSSSQKGKNTGKQYPEEAFLSFTSIPLARIQSHDHTNYSRG